MYVINHLIHPEFRYATPSWGLWFADGTTFWAHVKYIGGSEPAGSSIRLVNGPVRARWRWKDPFPKPLGAVLLQEQTSRPTQQSLESLGLSAREAEVTACAISGATNASISETMYISSATVKRHLENVYAKLGVKGPGELAAFVHDVLDRQLL